MEENNIEELKRLLYRNELSQYGKRKLIDYYEQQEKDYKRVLEMNEVLLKENEQLKKNHINLQDNANTIFCKVAIPPEPQLPIKTLCESFSKKVRNK